MRAALFERVVGESRRELGSERIQSGAKRAHSKTLARVRERPSFRCAGGFTLIELLVTIAIIAILASLILTSASQSKEKARNLLCQNNQRQIAMDYNFGVEDRDGRLDGIDAARWIGRNVGRSQVWICPSAQVKASGRMLRANIPSWGEVNAAWRDLTLVIDIFFVTHSHYDMAPSELSGDRKGSYAINSWLGMPGWDGLNTTDRQRTFQKVEAISYPTLTPITADSVEPWVPPLATDLPAIDLATGVVHDNEQTSSWMAGETIPRHGKTPRPVPRFWASSQPLPGAVNVGCGDGHVEQVKLDNLWQLYWHRGYVPPVKRPGLP